MGGITAEGINHLLRLFSMSEQAVSSFHVALILDAPPGFSSSGDELDEPLASSYTRGEMGNEGGNWLLQETTLSNDVEVIWPSASEDWGIIRHWAVTDAPIGGRVLYCGSFQQPFEVNTGGMVSIDPGQLSISISGVQWRV